MPFNVETNLLTVGLKFLISLLLHVYHVSKKFLVNKPSHPKFTMVCMSSIRQVQKQKTYQIRTGLLSEGGSLNLFTTNKKHPLLYLYCKAAGTTTYPIDYLKN